MQLTGTEWALIEIGNRAAPLGAGDKPATINFSGDGRAGGFAGCNQYSATYQVKDDELHFEAPVMTRMACDAGMELEAQLGAVLAATDAYRISGKRLELLDDGVVLAKFDGREKQAVLTMGAILH